MPFTDRPSTLLGIADNKMTLGWKIFIGLGWAIAFSLALVMVISAIYEGMLIQHAMFTFQEVPNQPEWMPISDTAGKLNAVVPLTYQENVTVFLLDQMTRYMRWYTKQATIWELRPGTRVIALIYSEDGTQLSCAVLEDEISNSTIVLFKGTTTKAEWTVNLKLLSAPDTVGLTQASANLARVNSGDGSSTDNEIQLHTGFQNFYATMRERIHAAILLSNRDNVYICGHSLGGAMSSLCLYDLHLSGLRTSAHMYAITVASPRVGNQAFAQYFDVNRLRIFQLQNSGDIVPCLPLMQQPSLKGDNVLSQYSHCGECLVFYEQAHNMLYAHAQISYQRHTSPKDLASHFELTTN